MKVWSMQGSQTVWGVNIFDTAVNVVITILNYWQKLLQYEFTFCLNFNLNLTNFSNFEKSRPFLESQNWIEIKENILIDLIFHRMLKPLSFIFLSCFDFVTLYENEISDPSFPWPLTSLRAHSNNTCHSKVGRGDKVSHYRKLERGLNAC